MAISLAPQASNWTEPLDVLEAATFYIALKAETEKVTDQDCAAELVEIRDEVRSQFTREMYRSVFR